jgi:hypothetical protein
MKNVKKYLSFVNEDLKDDISSKLKPEYKDLKDEIIDKIIKSLNSDDIDVFNDFIEAFIRDSDKNKIEGLINDSDVYEFYLSYRNDIDSLLSKINFYDEVPSEINCFSLYDYIIKGTMKAIEDIVINIKDESK